MEKINILSFNIKNFKTNNYYLTNEIVNSNIDICFITETWLAEEENQLIYDKFGRNFNILCQNEMSINTERRGRPFGGKCWLLNKKLKIGRHEYLNNDISFTEIVDKCGFSKAIVIGVHLPFDDNSNNKIANYISNLEIIKSIIDDNLHIPTLIVGDFNTDLETNKRFSRLLAGFIQFNKLKCMDYEFPNIDYTYKSGDNTSYIDHIIVNDIASRNVIECKIIENVENMSDHNSILTTIIINSEGNYDDNFRTTRNFYRFPWKEEEFVSNYQQAIEVKMRHFEFKLNYDLSPNEKSSYIEMKLKELKNILLQAARLADKNSEKQINIKNYLNKQKKRIWNPELANISKEMNFWYSKWLISNKLDEEASKNYKFYKDKFKRIQKILIWKDNNQKVLNLTKIYKMDRNCFWKIVKKYKAKKHKFNENKTSLKDFKVYYSQLFSNENIEEDEEQRGINNMVDNYYNDIKYTKYDIDISETLIDNCFKKLKNNKAVGDDNICNEMLKNAKCIKLTNVLKNVYKDIINNGIVLQNFNISLISPIGKKDSNTSDPEDFRPISVSSVFSNIYEMIILNQIEEIFKFNNKQFGYKANTSCKHASFIINEAISYYKKGGSPCYVISLDMKKAFDKMWRNGLFCKLIDKIEKPMWRAIYMYYKCSKAKVKINDIKSEEFTIKEGVKQGGILSPYLFNFFMNELLIESDELNLGAKIGTHNISLISYCDDLIILSPYVKHVNILLKLCSDYAKKWKLVFNTSKCKWYVHGKNIINNPIFLINQNELIRVNSLTHLGLPIGNQNHVEDFFCEKFRKVERSLYSLYSLGCNSYGLNFQTISSIYKKFCQSIFYYGLETNFIRKQCINKLNVRQNILLKNIFGLSKFSRSRALMSVLRIKSTIQLYEEYKILFIKQLKKNTFTKEIYETLQGEYNSNVKTPKESYFSIIRELNIKYNLNIDVNMNHNDVKESLEIIANHYGFENEEILNKLKYVINITGTQLYDNQARMELKLLLCVNFN
jgi:hypothetical protein